MRVGVGLRVRYEAMAEVAAAADELGYESVWLPDHLVLPVDLAGSPIPGDDHPPMDPSIPTCDPLLVLVSLASVTADVRLGTWVYNLALRHPIVTARAVQTLDILSGGRVVLGVGAGWVRGEYDAVGVEFSTRVQRLEESIEVLRLLWSEEAPAFEGDFFAFPPVRFEPKPHQGIVPIHVGGESDAALRRAARLADGWLGMDHDPASAADKSRRLEQLLAAAGRDRAGFEVTVGATGRTLTVEEIAAYADAGVDRVIVAPWQRSAEAVDGLARLAEEVLR